MPPAARRDDPHTCPNCSGGKILEGASNVYIEGKPAARLNDPCDCGDGPSHVGSASPTVKIEGQNAARVTDTTCHHGEITTGAAKVFIGDGGGGGPAGAMATARSNAAPFVRP